MTTAGGLRARGKVRDVYDAGPGALLLVATDRLSAFDVVLPEPVPDKGRVLTALLAVLVRAHEGPGDRTTFGPPIRRRSRRRSRAIPNSRADRSWWSGPP